MHLVKQRLLIYGALAAVSSAAVYGCKDFLSSAASPQGALNEATLSNKTGVEGSLISAYRALDCTSAVQNNWGCAASDWAFGSVSSGDAYKGSETGDQPPIQDIEAYNWSTPDADSYFSEKWRISYEGISRANATIRLLKEVVAANPNAIPADEQKSIEGESIFLRAHYHFELWEMFGNIPYYRESDTDYRKAQEASDAVISDILKDLDAAIALLPTTPWAGQLGRATSWTAKAFKGRVQVYAGQYQAAIGTLNEVKNNGPYALEASFDRVWSGFKEYENGKETILAFQASVNDGEPNANNSNYGERLNFPTNSSHFGCCGFHQPSQALVNHFRVDANGLPMAVTDSANFNNFDGNFNASASANVALDPRLDWTVGRDGVPYKDWGPHSGDWIRAPGFSGPYSPKKNIHEKASGAEATVGWAPAQQNSVNIHIFRYADLLLLLAEAEVEAGSMENARTLVNLIRARAGQKAQGLGTDRASIAVSLTDPSITWAKYKVGLYTQPWTDKNFARAAVREERNLELAMEGHRLFDLRSYGQAVFVSTLNNYLAKEKTRRSYLNAAQAVTSRHMLFPLPVTQIQLSVVNGQQQLKQNPGW